MEERKKRKPITLSLKPDVLKMLESMREETGDSVSSIVEKAILAKLVKGADPTPILTTLPAVEKKKNGTTH